MKRLFAVVPARACSSSGGADAGTLAAPTVIANDTLGAPPSSAAFTRNVSRESSLDSRRAAA